MSAASALLDTGILSLDPLITYTKRHPPTPIGVAGAIPELFAGQPSLHIISPSWYLHDWAIAEIASEIQRASVILPDARFLFLAASEHDAYRLAKAGIDCFATNSSIFTNERIFRPLLPLDGAGRRYDAVYNARFEPYKRHELAAKVESVALIYDRFDRNASKRENDIRQWLPTAHYLNHEYGNGQYRKLDTGEISVELNRAYCGLCLSAEEGEMRASIEYLLCGIPVVSTKSIGGRDRYFDSPYAIVTADDPQAIADAVAEMKRRKLGKAAVRDHVGRIVAHERSGFLKTLNLISHDIFGARGAFEDVRAFIDVLPFTDPTEQWSRVRLQPLADFLGKNLPPKAAQCE